MKPVFGLFYAAIDALEDEEPPLLAYYFGAFIFEHICGEKRFHLTGFREQFPSSLVHECVMEGE